MNGYELTYTIQNGVSPLPKLEHEFGDPEINQDIYTFYQDFGGTGEKRYEYHSSENKIIESLDISLLYVCLSLATILLLGLLVTFEPVGTLAYILNVIVALAGVNLAFVILLGLKSSEHIFVPPAKVNELFGAIRLLCFRESVTVSPLAFMNLGVGLVAIHHLIFDRFNAFSLIIIITLLCLYLMTLSHFDPTNNRVSIISFVLIYPFVIPFSNLLVYQQSASGFETGHLLLMNFLVIIVSPFLVKYWINRGSEYVSVHQTTIDITNQKYFRTAIVLLGLTYISFPIIVLITQVYPSPIVKLHSLLHITLIYWPYIGIIFILGFVSFNQVLKKEELISDIVSSHDVEFRIDNCQVIFYDIDDLAFPIDYNNTRYIILSDILQDELDPSEVKAVCYHEIYHLENNSIKYQSRVKTPIIGFFLFFVFTNPSDIYHEEYLADAYAAKMVDFESISSAISKTNKISGPDKNKLFRIRTFWDYAYLFGDPPILKIYRPSRNNRLIKLKNSNSQCQAD